MKDITLHLKGSVEEDTLSGWLSAKELRENFKPTMFFPKYQRLRLENKSKIKQLKKVFSENKKIDPLTLNLVGDFRENKKSIKMTGEFHIIDGQQRLWSLVELDCEYSIPVTIHYNLSYEQEVELFHRLNRTATKLTFGELVKSIDSPMADHFRKTLKDKKYPIPVLLRTKKGSVSATIYCSILNLVYRRLFTDSPIIRRPLSGADLMRFMEREPEQKTAQYTFYGTRNLLQQHAELFGNPSANATAWQRTFLLAWVHLIINNFMTAAGNIEIPKEFEFKYRNAPNKLTTDSLIKERCTSDRHSAFLYNTMIDYFNKSRTKHKLEHMPEHHC